MHYARRWQTQINLDGQYFPIGLVDDVQYSKGPAAIQGVVHKVQDPHGIELLRRNEWFFDDSR